MTLKSRYIFFCFLALLGVCCAWTATVPSSIATCRKLSTSTERAASPSTDAAVTTLTRDERVQELLQLARELGPVGVRQSAENQQRILDVALQLKEFSDDASTTAPAKLPLSGIHNLLYSAAPGGSSGKLGPFDGKVTQEFVDDKTFINAVELGPVRIALTASRAIKNDTVLAVKFHKTTVSVFGVQVIEKEIGGGGSWKMIFAGKVKDPRGDGTETLVRVMQTPSLFVIEQPIIVE